MPTFHFPVSDFCIGAFCPFMELFFFLYSRHFRTLNCYGLFFSVMSKVFVQLQDLHEARKRMKNTFKVNVQEQMSLDTLHILNVHQMFKNLLNVLITSYVPLIYIILKFHQDDTRNFQSFRKNTLTMFYITIFYLSFLSSEFSALE